MSLGGTEKKGLQRLETVCADAIHVQECLLKELLARGSQTEYGKRYNFSEIHTTEEYQRRAPLTEYGDYEELIGRQIQGEKNLLTTDETVFYCISAGSTSLPKYVPVTERDVRIQKTYLLETVTELIKRAMPGVPDEELFGRIFETGEFFRTSMPDGTMNGVRSGVLMRWLEEKGAFDNSAYTSPLEVLFPEKIENMLYVKLRFALADREVTAIHGVFVHGIVQMFHYLLENRDAFLEDIGSGDVSDCFQVSAGWKTYLKSRLAPDADRAEELRAILSDGTADGVVRRIWPKLRYIRMAGGSIFQSYMEELHRFTGDLPIHYYAYASSESVLGAVHTFEQDDARYVLIPEACFFEFIPDGDRSRRPLTFREVKAGESYELVITTLSGLYRYELGDIVEVTGFYGQAPVVRISYRKNQVQNVADEKMNVRQLGEAMRRFADMTGCRPQGYCVDAGFRGSTPFYLVYLELKDGKLLDGAEELLDVCFKESCFGYGSSREMGWIGKMQVVPLKAGSFQAYRDFLAGKGYRMEQNKPLQILRTQEQRDFFKNEVAEWKEGTENWR